MTSLSEIKFLTVAEVAALMRVSKMTVYRLVHSGELASVRVGRSFRVPERAVHESLRVEQRFRRGFRHQEAPQADGQEEAPQAAEEDPRPAPQQEVALPFPAAR
jgi:excisionase family DNA binding protein